MSEDNAGEGGKTPTTKKPETKVPVKRVRKKVKIVKRKKGGGAEFSEEAVPFWMSSGIFGAVIAGASVYAQSQGVGEAINEETITTGMLQTIEAVGIVLAAVGRFKAKNKLKLW